jgi:hypothetical protein
VRGGVVWRSGDKSHVGRSVRSDREQLLTLIRDDVTTMTKATKTRGQIPQDQDQDHEQDKDQDQGRRLESVL